jgi:hypothetical protein
MIDRLPTVFGEYVAEQHIEEILHRNLPAPTQEVGIAALWIVFYIVIAIATAIHYVSHARS